MKETFVPVTSLPDEVGEGFRIAWSLDPGNDIDQERITIDALRLGKLLNVVGLSGVAIEGSNEYPIVTPTNAKEERDAQRSYKVLLDSDFGDGEDYDDDNDEYDHDHDDEEDDGFFDMNLPRQLWRPNAAIVVNTDTLPVRVQEDSVVHGLTQEQAYAQQLDDIVRLGMVRAAYNTLLARPFHGHPYLLSIGVASALQGLERFIGIPEVTLQSYVALLIADRVQALAFNRMERKTWSMQGYKRSFFPFGVQPDRFAVTALRAIPRRGLVQVAD